MKYYIVYRIKNETGISFIGPYSNIEYIYKAMEIIANDSAYDLDIVNEPAMEFYFAYLSVEQEYKEAKEQLINEHKGFGWTVEDQVFLNRKSKEVSSILKELSEQAIKESDFNNTIKTISLVEDPYDFPF